MKIKKGLLLILLGFLLQNVSMANTFPQDVTDFIDRREACDHFRGEYSGEPEIDEGRNLYAQLEENCKGTDQQLSDLKKKYKNNAAVMEQLNEYEESIEASSEE